MRKIADYLSRWNHTCCCTPVVTLMHKIEQFLYCSMTNKNKLTKDKYTRDYVDDFFLCSMLCLIQIWHHDIEPSLWRKRNKVTQPLHLKNSQQQSRLTWKWGTVCVLRTKGPFFFVLSPSKMWAFSVRLVLLVLWSCQHSRMRKSKIHEHSKKEQVWKEGKKTCLGDLWVVIFFGTFVTARVTCANCWYSTWEQSEYHPSRPFVA